MAKRSSTNPKSTIGWRGFVVFILSFLGLISLVGFGFAHWTQRQLLTTDNWVNLVAPLPKDDAVATALSDYSVNRLFDKIDLDQKVADALPPKASFLAEPLSNQLEQRTKNRTKQVIQSDKFQGLWAEANRSAHKKLVDRARGETSQTTSKASTVFDLDLRSLGSNIREKLGNTSEPLFQSDNSGGNNDSQVDIAVSLKTSFSKFKKFVNVIDFLNGVLGLLALACILWAIAITRNRRRLIMILATATGAIALLQIIGIKALRPAVLNQIETQSYRPAVGAVYDDLVALFEHSATILFVVVMLIFALAFLVGYRPLMRHKHTIKVIRTIKSYQAYKQLTHLRKLTGEYRYVLMATSVFIVLIVLALMSGYDWQGIIRAALFAVILCALVRLFAVLPTKSIRGKTPM